jgi:mono/diheme cytochrome c family protein
VLLSGCGGETYPEDLEYPVRSGVMVMAAPTPEEPPTQYESLGQLNQLQNSLDTPELVGKKQVLNLDKNLKPDERNQYHKELNKLFGTPAHPKVEGIDAKVKEDLKLDDATLALGSQLYRRHCLHCHGLTGDGHGPTAPWVNPHPRDYRRGIFKYSSSSQDTGERKPRRQDLKRTLQDGIEGTSMPSFRLLPDNELEALVSYVIHLSLRGQAEFDTLKTQFTSGFEASEGETIPSVLAERTKKFAKNWWDSSFAVQEDKPKYLIEPGAFPAEPSVKAREDSVMRGYKLFSQPGPASCVTCHKDFGRQSPFSYDEWGTIIRPLDLTTGVYRGGRRPLDLYWRIHSGINGAGMTAFNNTLKPEEIWDLVNFLQALPYPQMLPGDLRGKIYGQPLGSNQVALGGS